ncbi:MAG: DNA alkylation repair protein [Oscillospiraceae bacterium]|nr:DNA alkylation repair protein [Oscillospiraceae bacterium]
MNRDEIVAELFRMQDMKYAAMQAKIIPTLEPDRIIGVRTPELRAFAKVLSDEEGAEAFLAALPHPYFDEMQLHAFVISLEKDFDKCLAEVEAFLPYIDNWATCDQLSPKAFKKEPEKLLPHIRRWIRSEKPYTVRFALGMLMQHFLDERFRPEYAELAASVRSEEYYVCMMAAWYFATALAKQYEAALPYLEEQRLEPWTHNKAIQKSIESYRLTEEQKRHLRTLKVGKAKEYPISRQ